LKDAYIAAYLYKIKLSQSLPQDSICSRAKNAQFLEVNLFSVILSPMHVTNQYK